MHISTPGECNAYVCCLACLPAILQSVSAFVYTSSSLASGIVQSIWSCLEVQGISNYWYISVSRTTALLVHACVLSRP